jgi:hypothetical protein
MSKALWSDRLSSWLGSDHPKTLAGLRDAFGNESFSLGILILMAVPALPLPTGGVTHLFEVIAFLLAIGLMTGGRLRLPKRWIHRTLPKGVHHTLLPRLIRWTRWYERHVHPIGGRLLNSPVGLRVVGALLSICIIAAFIAPPFSGLDTLPSLGAVCMAAALLLEDIRLMLAGCVLAGVGIGLIVTLGALAWGVLRHLV